MDEFFHDKTRNDQHTVRCKDCVRSSQQVWRESQPGMIYERKRAAERKYLRGTALMTKYGITENDYTVLLVKQGFRCAICKVPESESLGRNPGRLCIDHDHDTGVLRSMQHFTRLVS